MEEKRLAITCPLCGRSSDHALSGLREGADMVCPLCGVKLNLHGHMWEDIKKEIEKLNFRTSR